MRAGRPRTSSRWNVTDAAVVRPLVRPAFLKWSMVVFVLLVPFVVHAIWDYAESSRLAGNIARIRENHEPLSAYDIEPRPHPLGGEPAAAERFYGAAAVLARSDDDDFRRRLFIRIADAERDHRWPDALVADMRHLVDARAEAFRLLDRATTLSFAGFAPGTSYNYRTGDLLGLANLASVRTRRYLQAMPIDPFSGKPLRYTTRDGGYSVSSVGSNRAGGRDLGLRIRAPVIQ